MSIIRLKQFSTVRHGIDTIITTTPVLTHSTTIANGASNTFDMTVTATSKNSVLVNFFWTVWIGSVATGNDLPNGANVNQANWVVIPFLNDLAVSTAYVTTAKIYVQNLSGASSGVYLEYNAVVIQNSFTTGVTIT